MKTGGEHCSTANGRAEVRGHPIRLWWAMNRTGAAGYSRPAGRLGVVLAL